jgi:hypothetical protein
MPVGHCACRGTRMVRPLLGGESVQRVGVPKPPHVYFELPLAGRRHLKEQNRRADRE